MKTNKFFKKNLLFLAIIGAVILLEVFLFLFYGGGIKDISLFLHKSNLSPAPSGIILFEGNNCPQCDKVNTFVKNNNVEAKVAFTKLEVFNSDINANILADKAQTCGLDPSKIGVPFLWDGSHCIIGYVDVIKFFQQKITKKP